jgi:hypothetical protein
LIKELAGAKQNVDSSLFFRAVESILKKYLHIDIQGVVISCSWLNEDLAVTAGWDR